MAKETKIAWAHGTFNPWRGCVKVSPGCAHCYAEGWAKRTGKDIWGKDARREHASESYWKQPEKWNREAAASGKPFRVFCASLADVCEDRDDLLEPRARLMRLIEQTPYLTWLLCTKRPENFLSHFGRRWGPQWPRNVWALTTAENQEQADKRLPELMKVPAIVRGVSHEPALEAVDFTKWLTPTDPGEDGERLCHGHGLDSCHQCARESLNWIITGGESGSGARPFHMAWARKAKGACEEAGAVFFMKQAGARPVMDPLDSAVIRAQKGDDMNEWPGDLRVQEFPKA